jgi:hypothetical protein
MPDPLVVAHLYEHVSRRGKRYLVGRIGAVRLFLVDTGTVSRGSKVWQLTIDQGNEVTPEQLSLAQEVIAASTMST